jgi:hypothetical protein
MRLDLTDEETLALLNLLTDTIENDRYFLSPRIQTLKAIRAKVKPSKTQSPANYARSIEAEPASAPARRTRSAVFC